MKKIGILVAVLLIIGFSVYKYVYQPHRDIEQEEAAFTVKATDLVQSFLSDQQLATEKYLNKTIVVTGELTDLEDNAVTLNEVVYVTFDSDLSDSKADLKGEVKIKGRCIGFDELLEIVKFDQGTILK